MTAVSIRRSAVRMWLVALGGVPLVVLAADVLTQRRLTDALRSVLFRPEDTQIFETRDVIWSWVMLVVGVTLVVIGLKELMFPTVVVAADSDGVKLKLSGPFRGPSRVPWDGIDDIGSGTVDDEGDRLPVLWLKLVDPNLLPDQPWGARWIADDTIAVLAADWDRTAIRAAEDLAAVAIANAAPPEPPPEDPVTWNT